MAIVADIEQCVVHDASVVGPPSLESGLRKRESAGGIAWIPVGIAALCVNGRVMGRGITWLGSFGEKAGLLGRGGLDVAQAFSF